MQAVHSPENNINNHEHTNSTLIDNEILNSDDAVFTEENQPLRSIIENQQNT